MHTITISIQGDVSLAESVQVEDAAALPLFIRLKTILKTEEEAQAAPRTAAER